MKFKRHNPTVPLAIECALLFLAISVFGWGLQAKLSGYQTYPGRSTSAIYMTKLATEKIAVRTVASLEGKDQSLPPLELRHLTALSILLQATDFSIAYICQPEAGPRIPSQYGLPDPNLMRRPPPVLS
jgi:hypothetical protein